jgi:hypothetical protein
MCWSAADTMAQLSCMPTSFAHFVTVPIGPGAGAAPLPPSPSLISSLKFCRYNTSWRSSAEQMRLLTECAINSVLHRGLGLNRAYVHTVAHRIRHERQLATSPCCPQLGTD